jgi:hypothetical protein
MTTLPLSLSFKLIDATRGIIYNRYMFIVQATGSRVMGLQSSLSLGAGPACLKPLIALTDIDQQPPHQSTTVLYRLKPRNIVSLSVPVAAFQSFILEVWVACSTIILLGLNNEL